MRGGGRRGDKMNNEEMSPHHVTKHDSRHTCHVSRVTAYQNIVTTGGIFYCFMRPRASCANNWRLETRKCESRKQGHQLFKVDYSVVNQINEISIIKMLILYNYYNVDVDNEDFLSYDFNSIIKLENNVLHAR